MQRTNQKKNFVLVYEPVTNWLHFVDYVVVVVDLEEDLKNVLRTMTAVFFFQFYELKRKVNKKSKLKKHFLLGYRVY